MITQDRLKELMSYDQDTGAFTWITGHCNTQHLVGTRAGSVDANGYRVIVLKQKHYYEHRLAWLYMTGQWPKQIDHRDTNRSNNAWGNLRISTRSQNGANKALPRNNTSGFKGVSWCAGKWAASLKLDGKPHHLGRFTTKEAAAEAYRAKATEVFGEFARMA